GRTRSTPVPEGIMRGCGHRRPLRRMPGMRSRWDVCSAFLVVCALGQRDALDRIGIVGLSAACGFAGATMALFALAPDEPKPDAAPRVVPMTGQHAGLLVYGVW